MIVPVSDMKRFLRDVTANVKDGAFVGCFPPGAYTSESEMVFFRDNGWKKWTFDNYITDVVSSVFILPRLVRDLNDIRCGVHDLTDFVVNHPVNGQISIRVQDIYLRRYLPSLLSRILQNMNWTTLKTNREHPPMQFEDSVPVFKKLAGIPGGLSPARLIWDAYVPQAHKMPHFLNDDHMTTTIAGPIRNNFSQLTRREHARNRRPGG